MALTAAIAVIGAGIGAGIGEASAQEIVLRYATQLPAKHHLTQADMEFAETVAKRTNGRVKIEVYPAGQLFKGTAMVNAVRTGALDMGIIFGGAMTGMVPLIDVFDIPFMFPDYRAIDKHWQGEVGEIIRKQAEEKGIMLLSFGSYGDSFAVINSKRELHLPADFAGLKIRGNTPMSIESIEALGAAPLRMASSEVYAALQRGTVDGAATGLGTIVSRKWFEVSKYVTVTAASYSVWPVMVSVKKWETLPDDVKVVIREAALETQMKLINLVEEQDAKNAKVIAEQMTAHTLTDEERAVWREALAPVEKTFVERTGAEGEALLKAIRQ